MNTSINISNVPVPAPISLDGNVVENFHYFKEQWKHYCNANGFNETSENIKVSIFLLIIGKEAFLLLESLKLKDEDKNTIEKLIGIFEAYFKPVNIVKKRFEFNCSNQRDLETMQEYLNRLEILAAPCKFGENNDDMIRDRFLFGVKDRKLGRRLAKDPELTLEKIRREVIYDANKGPIWTVDDSDTSDSSGETNESSDETHENCSANGEFSSGSFIIAKSNADKANTDSPIWRIAGNALLQKYTPYREGDQLLHINTSVFSGWSDRNKSAYYPVKVQQVSMNNEKKHIVKLQEYLSNGKLIK